MIRQSTDSNSRILRARIVLRTLKRLFPHAGIILNYSNPWELLVAVILSAQCTDTAVNKVTTTLFKKYKTIDDYIAAPTRELESDIFSAGFYRVKTRSIKGAAKKIKKEYSGEVPHLFHELLTLPGVGRKTAHVVLGNAYGIVEGIAVDTHVKRLARVYGLTDQFDPDKIEHDLMLLFPKNEWFSLTYRMIEYGRLFCSARRHAHDQCPLGKALMNIS